MGRASDSRFYDINDPSSNPVRSTGKRSEVFRIKTNCADSLSVCSTPVCIRTHNNDHARTHVKDPVDLCQSSVDYGNTKRPSMHFSGCRTG